MKTTMENTQRLIQVEKCGKGASAPATFTKSPFCYGKGFQLVGPLKSAEQLRELMKCNDRLQAEVDRLIEQGQWNKANEKKKAAYSLIPHARVFNGNKRRDENVKEKSSFVFLDLDRESADAPRGKEIWQKLVAKLAANKLSPKDMGIALAHESLRGSLHLICTCEPEDDRKELQQYWYDQLWAFMGDELKDYKSDPVSDIVRVAWLGGSKSLLFIDEEVLFNIKQDNEQ